MKPVPHFATPELRSQAHALRTKATPAEAALWAQLRARRMQGLKFRRQHVALGYILDFYCPEYRLAVELDGSYHDPARDAQRDQALARWHVTVLRFPTDKPTEEIISAIHAAVRGLQLQMIKQAAFSTSMLKQMEHDSAWYAARRMQLKRQAIQLELRMTSSERKSATGIIRRESPEERQA